MHWWIITVGSICGALLIQYLCSSKILRIKQAISIKNIALRDARNEGERLDSQGAELKGQRSSLVQSIKRLRNDIRGLLDRTKEKGLDVPQPDFPLEDPIEDGVEAEN
jgi:chromosome segregation ATPase